MASVTVKTCSNPNCLRKDHIYLNGSRFCDLCGSALTSVEHRAPDEAAEVLDQMAAVQHDIKRLLLQTPRSLKKLNRALP
jgi:hypothetical protein